MGVNNKNICKNISSAGVFGHAGDQHAIGYCLQHCQLQLAVRVHVVLIKGSGGGGGGGENVTCRPTQQQQQ